MSIQQFNYTVFMNKCVHESTEWKTCVFHASKDSSSQDTEKKSVHNYGCVVQEIHLFSALLQLFSSQLSQLTWQDGNA